MPPGARLGVGAALDAGVGTARSRRAGRPRSAVGGRARGRIAFVAGVLLLWPVDTTSAACACTSGGCRSTPASAAPRGGAASPPTPSSGSPPALLSETALDLAAAAGRQTAIELGARGALGFRLRRVAPGLVRRRCTPTLIPVPAEIYALPQGVAGHTPYLWIGATAGAAVGFAVRRAGCVGVVLARGA